MKKLLLIVMLALLVTSGFTQVAINETGVEADPSAILDLSSTTKGFLVPRVTQAQRISIGTTQGGLLVFDTDSQSFWYYDNIQTGWVEIATDGSQSINKLSDGINDNNHLFLGTNAGTSDTGRYNTGVGFYSMHYSTSATNNSSFGYENLYSNITGNGNTSMGAWAMLHNTTGGSNVAIGAKALYSNTERSNLVAIGDSALFKNGLGATESYHGEGNTGVGSKTLYSNTTGYRNTALGYEALKSNYNGNENTAVGYQSLKTNITGSHNVALGNYSLINNYSGIYNTSLGYKAMQNNVDGDHNVAVGSSALISHKTGDENVAIGPGVLYQDTSGTKNTAIGSDCMFLNKSGSYNVALGSSALYKNLGDFNTGIGMKAIYNNSTGNNNIAIGYMAGYGDASSSFSGCVFIGYKAGQYNSDDNKLYIDNSNTSTPLIGGDFNVDRVDINGTIKITGGNPDDGKVLTSDTDGNATWETPTVYASCINDLSDGFNEGSKLFMGTNAGLNNTGIYNTGIGYEALKLNTTGTHNTALGFKSLDANTEGKYNSAFGHDCLTGNTTGDYNTAVGYKAMATNTTGYGNTALGFQAYTNGNYSNAMALGYNASVSGSNQVHIGNTSVTEIKGQVAFTTYSDGRIKENIKEDVKGLDFILKLRPVTYNINLDKENRILGIKEEKALPGKYDIEKVKQSGFIAQEVEAAAREAGYDFSAIDKPEHEHDLYGLSYAGFVVPLVKSVQELNQKLEKENKELRNRLVRLEKAVNELQRIK